MLKPAPRAGAWRSRLRLRLPAAVSPGSRAPAKPFGGLFGAAQRRIERRHGGREVLAVVGPPGPDRPEPDRHQPLHPQFAADAAAWVCPPPPASSACCAAWRGPAAVRSAARRARRAAAPARRRGAPATRRSAASAGRTAGRAPGRPTAASARAAWSARRPKRSRIAARPGNRSRARASGSPAARAAAATLTERHPCSAASLEGGGDQRAIEFGVVHGCIMAVNRRLGHPKHPVGVRAAGLLEMLRYLAIIC